MLKIGIALLVALSLGMVLGIVLGEFKVLERLLSGTITRYFDKKKQSSLDNISPFEKISSDQWLAESANAYVIEDHFPIAPVHLLVISKQRVESLNQTSSALLGEMLTLVKQVAKMKGISESGFRTVINTNPNGMQSVYHLHMHVIGGRQLFWPLG